MNTKNQDFILKPAGCFDQPIRALYSASARVDPGGAPTDGYHLQDPTRFPALRPVYPGGSNVREINTLPKLHDKEFEE